MEQGCFFGAKIAVKLRPSGRDDGWDSPAPSVSLHEGVLKMTVDPDQQETRKIRGGDNDKTRMTLSDNDEVSSEK